MLLMVMTISGNLQIHKEEVDDYHPKENSEAVPHCELVARWTKQDQEIQTLEYLLDILGTADEKFFTIIINPLSSQRNSTVNDI